MYVTVSLYLCVSPKEENRFPPETLTCIMVIVCERFLGSVNRSIIDCMNVALTRSQQKLTPLCCVFAGCMRDCLRSVTWVRRQHPCAQTAFCRSRTRRRWWMTRRKWFESRAACSMLGQNKWFCVTRHSKSLSWSFCMQSCLMTWCTENYWCHRFTFDSFTFRVGERGGEGLVITAVHKCIIHYW